jgi:hypothetical protein
MVLSFSLVGCNFTDLITPEDPVVTVPKLEAVAVARLAEGEGETYIVEWSIVNVGDEYIELYKIKFDIYYPVETKDNVILEVIGGKIDVGDFHEGILILLEYGDIEPEGEVYVSWKLF